MKLRSRHQKSSQNVIGISIYNLKMTLSSTQTPQTFFTMKWARGKGNVPASWVQKAGTAASHEMILSEETQSERSQRVRHSKTDTFVKFTICHAKSAFAVLAVSVRNF